MHEPSDVLHAEHEAIEALVNALEGIAAHIRTADDVPADDLRDALTVVVEFADRCHHAKEEVVLFPPLSAASPQIGADLARRLTSDHRAFRRIVGTIQDLLPSANSRQARRLLAKHLDTYTRVLREHIRVEEEQLLPEVERSLPPWERDRLTVEFQRVERDELGHGLHDAYVAIIRRLAETYAS